MNLIYDILRGVVIGVANIIPGVSGGTMMVSMGIYDTIIHCITHLFSEFKKSIKTLWPYALGMLVGIFALASLLEYLFENFALPTTTAFIGLILGCVPLLLRKVNRKKIGGVSILMFVLFFAGIVALGFVGAQMDAAQTADATAVVQTADVAAIGDAAAVDGTAADAESGWPRRELLPTDVGTLLILLAMGVVAAATMVIPGVSGSMMLMLLGYYDSVLAAVNELKDALLAGAFGAMGHPILLLLPFGVGVVIGIFVVAKLIEFLLERFPTPTYCAVLGLVGASPIAILLRTNMAGVTWVTVLVSLVTFALGFAGALLLGKAGRMEEAVAAPTETKVEE